MPAERVGVFLVRGTYRGALHNHNGMTGFIVTRSVSLIASISANRSQP